ncbi:MAG: ComEC/Rec2 family competence protein [Rhodospirillales bacterium]
MAEYGRIARVLERLPTTGVYWLPVAMGCGIALYFGLDREPPFWIAGAALASLVTLGYVARRRYGAFWPIILLIAATTGFLAAQIETAAKNTRFIERDIGPVGLTGQVTGVEPLASGARLTVQQVRLSRLEPYDTPQRVRITTRAGDAETIRAGDWIRATVELSPPSTPILPGSFNFRRHAYFEGIGARGFSYGAPEIVRRIDATRSGLDAVRFNLDNARAALARRIMDAVPGESGTIAAALLTGHRRAIPDEAADAMRDSGLAHLLAISGLHVGMVAGIVFFALRAALAAIPAIALRHPIKKWAAVAALVTAFLYMIIAGASVPTQRAFIMTAFVMVAVMIDRRAITLRLVAWAAIAVLLVSPHALVEPGFQMSFAAVVALVAAYEAMGPWFIRRFPPNGPWHRRAAGYLAGVGLSTLIAGTATAPFALYHFQQSAVFGLLANMVAVPATGLWVLPSGLVALLAMPTELEAIPLTVMASGIGVILEVARSIADLPNAVAHVPLLPAWFVASVTAGGILLTLLRGPFRLAGLVPIVVAAAIVLQTRPPDVIASSDARLIARLDGGAIQFLGPGRRAGGFEKDMLLRAAGRPEQRTTVPRPGDDTSMRCDHVGCRWTSAGHRIAVVWQEAALIEDCWDTDILIASVPVRRSCPGPAHVVDRFDLWERGGVSITVDHEGVVSVRHAEPGTSGRPWQRRLSTDG